MRALLLSTYELGHQPLHLAGPAAALTRAGHQVRCVDLAVTPLAEEDVLWADAVAVSVPMHTAMRLARQLCGQLRAARPELAICFFGLYAGTDDGAGPEGAPDHAISGEYEGLLVAWFASATTARRPGPRSVRVELGRGRPALPARRGLPPLEHYARLVIGTETRLAGYVEASHGCAHRCRHCPVPAVYDGRTRIVGVEDVLADVAQLVGLGARHVTFGDPDFLNGPHHARRMVSALHGAFPDLTFDITAKVEHVLAHQSIWPEFAAAGCLFVVSAFESASDRVLEILDKGHTVADEAAAVRVLRGAGIEPRPSLLPFTPWTTAGDMMALLDLVARCDLIGNVDAVQYAIRLLVPPGSLLLDSGHLDGRLGTYDTEHLGWQWRSPDPRLDELQLALAALAERAETWDAADVYDAVRQTTCDVLSVEAAHRPAPPVDETTRSRLSHGERPRLSEAWFCCAEPTDTQFLGASLASVANGGR